MASVGSRAVESVRRNGRTLPLQLVPQVLEAVKLWSLVVYVPTTHANEIRAALTASGAGAIGAYDSCSFSSVGVGRFRPLSGASPFIGKVGMVEVVSEERIETEVSTGSLSTVLSAVRAAHPYEQPAVHVSPILSIDWSSFSSNLATKKAPERTTAADAPPPAPKSKRRPAPRPL